MIHLLPYLGIPSILSAIVLGLLKALHSYCKKHFAISQVENEALKNGMQALLRDRLLRNYREFSEKGYAETDEKDNWENLYKQYKSLGGNGVVTKIHDKVLVMPDFKKGV